MQRPPFELIQCSWPRPVEQADGRWVSEPTWDAPVMPWLPQWRGELIDDELFLQIDWRDVFRQGLTLWDHRSAGEMRGFHVVFRLRIHRSGTLIFWDDDGSLIRRNGTLIHVDPSAHVLTRHEIDVEAGDELEVAQWQVGWGWLWAARLREPGENHAARPVTVLRPYLARVQARLAHPSGPPLKLYTSGSVPLRAVLAVYSLVLNGYVPSQVHLFGEEQWSPRARELFATLLPFAQVVSPDRVIRQLQTYEGGGLAGLARRHWFVMKMCIALLYPPEECCVIDDDVFVIDRLHDALAAFQDRDLVYTPDQDLGNAYLRTWGRANGTQGALRTGRFNAGLYWVRRRDDPRWLAGQALRARPNPNAPYLWEQGFIATVYANRRTLELPNQRYIFPLFDGLPGGLLGYDYRLNPCGFASVHFGGLAEKPTDGISLQLAPQLLDSRGGSADALQDGETACSLLPSS